MLFLMAELGGKILPKLHRIYIPSVPFYVRTGIIVTPRYASAPRALSICYVHVLYSILHRRCYIASILNS
jgi:hypothetical protein